MSNTGLRFKVDNPHAAHRLDGEIIQFVGIGAAAGPGNPFATIDGVPLRVLFDERLVARRLDQPGDFIDGIIPGDVLPIGCSRTPHLWLHQAPLVENVLLKRRSLWAKRAAIDWVIWITFDVNHLWRGVLGFVAERVNDDAATDRAIWAGRARL